MNKTYPLLLSLTILISSTILFSSVNASEAGIENTWESKPSIPQTVSRYLVQAVTVNDKIFVFSQDSSLERHTYMYDPSTGSWAQKSSMPTSRVGCAITVVDDKIYVVGGQHRWVVGETGSTKGYPTGLVEVYDVATDTWETKQPMINVSSSVMANSVNGKIYVIYQLAFNFCADVYDPLSNSWERRSILPPSVLPFMSCVIDAKIYMFTWERNLDIYDTTTGNWATGACIPQSYTGSAIIATTGEYAPKRIYVIGGGIDHGFVNMEAVNSNYVYDPVTDSWSTAADLPTARIGSVIGVVDDKIYAIGGTLSFDTLAGNPTNVIEVYTPIGYGKVPPVAQIASPVNNQTYTTDAVALEFTTDKPAATITYSLNNNEPVTITGNTTLTGLTSGEYNLTLTLTDEQENTRTQTITFKVETSQNQQTSTPQTKIPNQNQTATIAGTIIAITIIITASVLLYRRKNRQ